MKLINTFLILLFAFSSIASPADSLKRANELYAESEFQAAALLYESILDQNYESAALYYNLGNAYYKSGEYTLSILNYERALLLDPNNESIQFNLQLANQFVIDNIEPLPTPFFIKWIQNLANLQSADNWSIFSIVAFLVMLAFALVFLFSRTLVFKKTGFILAIIFLILSSTSLMLARKQHQKLIERNHAIIFTPTVTVKSSPDVGGTDLFVIHEGLKVEIKQQINIWLEIRLEDGNTGWVQQGVLEII